MRQGSTALVQDMCNVQGPLSSKLYFAILEDHISLVVTENICKRASLIGTYIHVFHKRCQFKLLYLYPSTMK